MILELGIGVVSSDRFCSVDFVSAYSKEEFRMVIKKRGEYLALSDRGHFS